MTRLARCCIAGCLAVLLAAVLPACTSSSGKSGSSSSASRGSGPSGTDSGAGSGSAPPTGAAPGPTASTGSRAPAPPAGSGRPADPSTKKSITDAYAAFFNSTSTAAQSQAALQHGRSFTEALQEQSKGQYSDTSSVRVGAIRVAGNRAYVTFTILSKGKPLLTNFKGYAAREAGRWKVAAITFCTLLQLQGGAPLACNDPTITALPQ